jgi:hypothetical protein
MNTFFSVISRTIGIILFMSIYFLPAMIAYSRDKKKSDNIFFFNLFLGWTFIGWVASLVWALKKEKNN